MLRMCVCLSLYYITAFYALFLFGVLPFFLCFIHPQGGRHLWLPSCWVDEMAIKIIQKNKINTKNTPKVYIIISPLLFFTSSVYSIFSFFRRIFIFWWPLWYAVQVANFGQKWGRKMKTRETVPAGPDVFILSPRFFFLAFIWGNMQRTATVWATHKKRRISRPASHPQKKKKRTTTTRS